MGCSDIKMKYLVFNFPSQGHSKYAFKEESGMRIIYNSFTGEHISVCLKYCLWRKIAKSAFSATVGVLKFNHFLHYFMCINLIDLM